MTRGQRVDVLLNPFQIELVRGFLAHRRRGLRSGNLVGARQKRQRLTCFERVLINGAVVAAVNPLEVAEFNGRGEDEDAARGFACFTPRKGKLP